MPRQSNVDNSIIDFSLLISQVLFGSFHFELPPTFKKKEPESNINPAAAAGNRREENMGGEDGKRNGNKKKKLSLIHI